MSPVNNPVVESATAGITAFAGGGQASATALTSEINEISTVATTGDSVKLPAATAAKGNLTITVRNNGANACDVFPNTDDNLGAGVDTAVSLGPSATATYFSFDSTNWVKIQVDFTDGADTAGAARIIGNVDNFDFGIGTNGTVRMQIQNNGLIGITKISGLGATLHIEPVASTVPALLLQEASGQSVDLMRWNNSVGTLLGGINSAGDFFLESLEINADLNHDGSNIGFFGTAPAAQAAAYTRNATIVEDRTLLASASATTINNNNVLAALIADLQSYGLLQ